MDVLGWGAGPCPPYATMAECALVRGTRSRLLSQHPVVFQGSCRALLGCRAPIRGARDLEGSGQVLDRPCQ